MRDPFGPWPTKRRLIWLVVTLLVCLVFGPRFVSAIKPPRYDLLDFYQEWSSAKSAVQGLPVYSSLDVTVPRFLGLQKRPGTEWHWSVNVHPPSSVLLALPLQGLEYRTAFLVWNLLSLAALAIGVWLLIRGLDIRFSIWCLMPLLCLALVADPLFQQVMQGQLNLVLLLLLVGVWAADRGRHPIVAGTLLAAAIAIKLFPGFLLLYFLLQRKWLAAAATCLGLIVITGLTSVVLGTETYSTYVTEILPSAASWKGAWNNASLAGFWHKLFDPSTKNGTLAPLYFSPTLARVGTLASWLLVIAALAPIIWRSRTRTQSDNAFGLCLAAMLLVSPVTWEHYFLLLLPTLVILWSSPSSSKGGRWLLLPILIAMCLPVIMLGNVFIPGGFFNGQASVSHTLTLLSFQFYALGGLFVLGWFNAQRELAAPVPEAKNVPDAREANREPAQESELSITVSQ